MSPAAIARPLVTERLTIRPSVVEDAAAVWRFRQLESVAEWVAVAPSGETAFADKFAQPERLANRLVIERDGLIIGDLMLTVGDPWSQVEVAAQAAGTQAELGWVLDPAHGGQGYATEAVAELVRAAFEDLGLRRIVAECFADNHASWRLMERVGMRREHHSVADALHRTRGWIDSYSYALLADEWRAGRG